jgi:LysM repeat protein
VGDTFWTLARIYGVNVQSIVDANPGVNADNLQIGSTLCIPIAPTPPVAPVPPKPTPPPAPTPPMPPKPPVRPITCQEGTLPYTVQVSDTLWKLSLTYGVSVQSIVDANPGVDADNLQIGSILCIPAATTPPVPPKPPKPTPPPAPTPPSCCPSDFAYVIQKCDSICGIARKFYVSVESILKNNPGIDPKCLQVGTCIYVPVNCCGKNTCRYTVKAGDSLNRIANKFSVCPSDLIAANPNIDFKHLVRCQVICIPNM